MDDRSFRQILDYFNLSWKGYRKVRKGVKKRLSRHMKRLGCRRVETYLDLLNRHPARRQEGRRCLTVSISRFFRDRSLWEALEEQILPDMTAGRNADFRVWSCGCARGEEVYSFNIVWDQLRRGGARLPPQAVLGTDMHPEYLEMAEQGAYGISSLKELSAGQIERYFDKVPGKQRYFVRPILKQAVRFELLDIVRDSPPAGSFEMIFVRNNVLTYSRSPEKDRALEKIVHRLAPGGRLITGSHERLPGKVGGLQPCPQHPWIYLNDSLS